MGIRIPTQCSDVCRKRQLSPNTSHWPGEPPSENFFLANTSPNLGASLRGCAPRDAVILPQHSVHFFSTYHFLLQMRVKPNLDYGIDDNDEYLDSNCRLYSCFIFFSMAPKKNLQLKLIEYSDDFD